MKALRSFSPRAPEPLETRTLLSFQYLPGTPITIYGSFVPGVPTTVLFKPQKGHTVSVVPINVTSTSVQTAVPFYLNPKNQNLASGTFTMTVEQTLGYYSYPTKHTVTGSIRVADPPGVSVAPGTYVNEFLTSQLTLDQNTVAAYIKIANASRGQVNVNNLVSNLFDDEEYITNFQQAISQIQTGQTSEVLLGQLGGKPLAITASSLTVDDRMLNAMAIASEEFGPNSVNFFVKGQKHTAVEAKALLVNDRLNSLTIESASIHAEQFADSVATYLTNLFGIGGSLNVPIVGPVTAQQWVSGAVQLGTWASIASATTATALGYAGLGIAGVAAAGFLVPVVGGLGLGYFLYNGYQQILTSNDSAYYGGYVTDANAYSDDPNAQPANDYYTYSQDTTLGTDLSDYYSDSIAAYDDVYGDSSDDIASQVSSDYSGVYDGLT